MPLSRALVPTVVTLLFGLLLLSAGSPPEAAAAAEGRSPGPCTSHSRPRGSIRPRPRA